MKPCIKRWLTRCALALAAACSLTGCGLLNNRVVFVDGSNAVLRLDDDVKGHVFYQNEQKEWVRSGNRVQIPAGWYVLRLDNEKK